MNDTLKAGCTLEIHMTIPGKSKQERNLAWLTAHSGLSKEYINKILATKTENGIYKIKFDSSANCFEAMQQISPKSCKLNQMLCFGIKVLKMICPCGCFVKINLFCDFDNIEMQPILKEYEKYGLILNAERVKTDQVNTGDIRIIMFVKEGSKVLDEKWLDSRKDQMKVEQYFAEEKSRIPFDVVDDLWKGFGYFARLPSVTTLAVCGGHNTKDIEQVD